MDQNVNSLITGLSQGLNKYLDLGVENNINQLKTQQKLANDMTLKNYESNLDLSKGEHLEKFKASLEDAIKGKNSVTLSQLASDPEFAPLAAMAPDARLDAKDLMGFLKDRDKAKQEKLPKEFQYKAGNYYKMAQSGENTLDEVGKRIDLGSWHPIDRNDLTPEILRSQDWKQFMSARKGIAEAYLRPATGATINKDEYANVDKIFMPLPGDSPKVQAGKKANRAGLRSALKAEAEGKQVDLTIFKPVTEDSANTPSTDTSRKPLSSIFGH